MLLRVMVMPFRHSGDKINRVVHDWHSKGTSSYVAMYVATNCLPIFKLCKAPKHGHDNNGSKWK